MKPSSRPLSHGPLEALQKGLRAPKIRLAVLDALSRGNAQRTTAQTGCKCRRERYKQAIQTGMAHGVCALRVTANAQIECIVILMVTARD